MKYVVTITERAPTEDGTDLNTYHVIVSDLLDAAARVERFALNCGLLVAITIAPLDEATVSHS